VQCLYVRAGGCAVLVRRAVLVCACSACMCVQGDVQCLFVRAVLACACSACMCMQCLYVRAVLVRACRGMCSACTCVQGDVCTKVEHQLHAVLHMGWLSKIKKLVW